MSVNDRRKIGIAWGGEKHVLTLVLRRAEGCYTGADDTINSIVTTIKRHDVLFVKLGTPKQAPNMHGHGLIGVVLATRPSIHDGTGDHAWVIVKVLQNVLPRGIVRNIGNFSNA